MHRNRILVFLCSFTFLSALLTGISAGSDSVPQIEEILNLGGIAPRPPLIDGDTLYSGTLDNKGLAFSLSSGKEIWKKNFKSAVTTTPVKFGSLVILVTDIGDRSIYALNTTDFKKAWSEKLYGGNSIPLVWEQSLIVPQDRRIVCLDGASGATQWEVRLDTAVKSSGIIAEGKLFLGGDDGNLYILGSSGEMLSQVKLGSSLLSDLSYDEGLLAVGDYSGTVYVLRTSDYQILWESKLPAPILSAAIFYQGLIICNSLDGTWRGYDETNGEQIWEYKCPALVRGNWSVCKDCLIFGADDGYLYGLEAKTGLVEWRLEIDGRALWGCTVDGEKIYIPTAAKKIIVLDFP
jgi:outer membrane protein assembly factor BamB